MPHQYLDSNSEPMSHKTQVQQQAQNFVFRKLTPSQIHIVNEKWDSCVQHKTLILLRILTLLQRIESMLKVTKVLWYAN
jgi:hypothetical protein